ncbi:Multidrug resistance protein ABC transporter [Phytophthora megakarya]|uniref:Multidrug resistance protein ABC transporter n=1 Tax=Phytophthora megakarya TaxID=4795 RepID=A0A225UNN4_9STRA|nr:Multidrug resistance protein ABC transporter [Phytophthora megakarya]
MNESKTEGLPYGWDGKDWRRYKWTMRTIFREHGLLEIAERKTIRGKLISEEGEAAYDKKQYKIMRMIGTTILSDKHQQVDHYESGSEMWADLCVWWSGISKICEDAGSD